MPHSTLRVSWCRVIDLNVHVPTEDNTDAVKHSCFDELELVFHIQGIYKIMVRFQKLLQNLFLILHGHNIHCQQRELSKFIMR
jgi:hypothetical protein